MTSESSIREALPEIRGYRLLRVVGHGGMSTVYLAEQESLGRKVAVKVMLPEALADEVSRRRFENEARTMRGWIIPTSSASTRSAVPPSRCRTTRCRTWPAATSGCASPSRQAAPATRHA